MRVTLSVGVSGTRYLAEHDIHNVDWLCLELLLAHSTNLRLDPISESGRRLGQGNEWCGEWTLSLLWRGRVVSVDEDDECGEWMLS